MIQSSKQESQLIKELYEHDKYNFFPNIIQRIETSYALYIVMDFIDGTAMNVLLRSGAFSHSLTIEYGKEICLVTQFLHEYGKIYSDMKPDNLMITGHSAESDLEINKRISTLKLIDFGAVVQMESGIPVQYTPEYAAPEQFRTERLDRRTDIFNIGATLYNMVTGRKPVPVCRDGKLTSSDERFLFEKDTNINSHLKKIILKCVNDDPDKRYRSCRELYHELEKAEKQTYLKLTLTFAAVAVLSAVLCVFSYFQCIHSADEEYDRYIRTAEKSASYSEKISAYISAADLKKGRTDAYFGLIEAYKSDISFDENESAEFTKLISQNTNELKNDENYELLAFETGKLYWYYYDYGTKENSENGTTRIVSSAEWFSEALNGKLQEISPQKYQMAQIYHDIGSFHADIQQLVIEGDDASMYEDYWKNINAMTDYIENSRTETEIVLLETYKLALNSLETYAYKFSAFVPYEEQKGFFRKIKEKTNAIMTTTEKTNRIKESIQERFDGTDAVIEKAYGGTK